MFNRKSIFHHLIDVPTFCDSRGSLSVVDNFHSILPFNIDRVFWLHAIPDNICRGCHAHRSCFEFVVAISGSIRFRLEDERGSSYYYLDNSTVGLLIPPYTWCEMDYFSKDCVCLCLASDGYDVDGYIHSYEQFKQIILTDVED